MLALRIEWVGREEHKRFVINRGDQTYWTGGGWSPSLKDARLFSTHSDASMAFRDLAEQHFAEKPVRRFTLLATVTVRGDQEFSLDDLRDYLASVCSLSMNTTVLGFGPAADTWAVVELPWDQLREEV